MTKYSTNEELKKQCNLCRNVYPADIVHFYRHKGGKFGLSGRCKECRGGSFGVKKTSSLPKAKEGNKYCGGCKKELPLDHEHFYRKKNNKSGWGSWCKECWGIPYGVHQINKTYKAQKGHKFCAVCEKEFPFSYFSKTKDNKDGHHSTCKQCSSIKAKEYSSRPLVKTARKKYFKAWRKKYYSTEKGIAMNLKHVNIRRSRKANTIYNYSTSVWKETLESFNHSCAYCGKTEVPLHQEHVIPLSKGGYYTKRNIIPACQFCNSSKHDRDLSEWYPKQPYFSEERLSKIAKWANVSKDNTQQLEMF